MGKIALKTFVIILLVLLPALVMNMATSLVKDPIGYQYAYAAKLQHLQATEGQRLILIGGSNLAFGVDSKMLQDSLGMPVVNMGLHAGLGLRFEVESVKPFLRHGDVLLVVPEYENYQDNLWLGETYLANVVISSPTQYLPLLNIKQTYTVAKNYFKSSFANLAFEFTGKHDPSSYKSFGFNAQGDYIDHYDKHSDKGISPRNIYTHSYNEEAVAYLGETAKLLQAQGIQVLVGFPAMLKEGYEGKKDFVALAEKDLRKNIAYVVGTPHDYVFDKQDVYDTEYHLTQAGTAKRTLQLIVDVRPMLPQQSR